MQPCCHSTRQHHQNGKSERHGTEGIHQPGNQRKRLSPFGVCAVGQRCGDSGDREHEQSAQPATCRKDMDDIEPDR